MNQTINIKSSLQDLGILLDEIYKEYSKGRGSYQTRQDLIAGNFRTTAGLIVPLRMHRYVYENYGVFILRSYVSLFQHMLTAENETFIQTAFRIQQELGIKKVDVFLSGILSQEELKKITLIYVLSDWVLIGGADDKSKFEKLFNEERHILDANGQKIFSNISKEISKTTKIPLSFLKPMKRYRENFFGEYSRKIPPLNFINGPNLDMLFSYWSELLHGNPWMLEQIFNEKLRWRSKNRLYAILWFTAQHVLRRLQPAMGATNLKERIENMTQKSDEVWRQLTDEWTAEAKKHK